MIAKLLTKDPTYHLHKYESIKTTYGNTMHGVIFQPIVLVLKNMVFVTRNYVVVFIIASFH